MNALRGRECSIRNDSDGVSFSRALQRRRPMGSRRVDAKNMFMGHSGADMASAGWSKSISARFIRMSLSGTGFVALLLLTWTGATHAAECPVPLAQLVLVKGSVELVRQGGLRPVVAEANAGLCTGDTVVVHLRSQAALLLSNATVVRLDQGTTVTLSSSSGERAPLLNVVSGAIYVISRTPRPFRVRTPFINANVEGTEFLVEARRGGVVNDARCAREPDGGTSISEVDRVTVFEGRVRTTNDSETVTVTLEAGETAVATASTGPTRALIARPRDAAVWTLYVPSVIAPSRAYPDVVDCAARLVALGGLDEAKRRLENALVGTSALVGAEASVVNALLATIAVAENETAKARRLAELAVVQDPGAAESWIALSYVQQASFQIQGAVDSVSRAVAIAPDADKQARLAELQMATGDVDAALLSASEASRLNPRLARAATVLGFVHLARIETRLAKEAFVQAIRIDNADPLPRLGLGLAKIREGDLPAGREEIEIAAALDTESSLVRSYLGKAYYEEHRDRLAETQLDLAKNFDPNDPTPWFYDAILAQAGNRPAASLENLQKSIALNDNRAVYRSRLLLDQDQAARMVSLARTYRMLGFDQLGLLEAVKSLSLDPGESSAHRFLADAYSGQVRSEAARVGELFQSQLRQPLGLNTIPPHLLADRRQLVEAAGPVQASAQEFTPLFNRDQVVVRFDGFAGNLQTAGEQAFVSGLVDRSAYSFGQYHYETDGLRPNNDYRRDIYTAFAQVAATPSLRLQAEVRSDHSRQGDLSTRFDPDDFSRNLRDEQHRESTRAGGLYTIGRDSSVVASVLYGTSREKIFSKTAPIDAFVDREELTAVELQYVFKARTFHVTTGISLFRNGVVLEDSSGQYRDDEKGRSLYALAVFTGAPWGVKPQLGVSFDVFDRGGIRVSRTDPKLGLLWEIGDTTIRAAVYGTIKRSFDANQTLQPSQVFGFNQSFDDPNGTLARGKGVALHHRLTSEMFAGVEWTSRRSEVPGFPGDPYSIWSERFAKAYLYRVVDKNWATTAEFQFERLTRPPDNPGNEAFTLVRTVLAPVSIRFNSSSGWSSALQVTFVKQNVRSVTLADELVDGHSRFAVVDASVGHQLPRRAGTVSIEAKNLFGRRFNYQEVDAFSAPRFGRRALLVRLSAVF